MATGYGSEVVAAVHETVLDMAEAGAISKRTMREFDEMCLTHGRGTVSRRRSGLSGCGRTRAKPCSPGT